MHTHSPTHACTCMYCMYTHTHTVPSRPVFFPWLINLSCSFTVTCITSWQKPGRKDHPGEWPGPVHAPHCKTTLLVTQRAWPFWVYKQRPGRETFAQSRYETIQSSPGLTCWKRQRCVREEVAKDNTLTCHTSEKGVPIQEQNGK